MYIVTLCESYAVFKLLGNSALQEENEEWTCTNANIIRYVVPTNYRSQVT